MKIAPDRLFLDAESQVYRVAGRKLKDSNIEYIRADLARPPERHQRLVELLSDIKGDLGSAEWGTPEHGEEILMGLIDKYYPKIKAALEGEG